MDRNKTSILIGIAAMAITVVGSEIYSSNFDKSDVFSSDTKWLQSALQLDDHRYATEDLANRVHAEKVRWHLTPWLHIRTINVDGVEEEDCYNGSALDDFPSGILTEQQRRNGGFLLHIIGGIYSFTLLAVVCNDYFIPSVECICESLKIPRHIAAATFMAVATSFPEFFVNVISTFITESDLGIGTIVGSALFNLLGVAAVGGIAAIYPIAIDPRPVTRDCLIYAVNVSILVAIVWDGRIYWYESLVLVILYIIYFVFMFNSTRLFAMVEKNINKRKATKESSTNGVQVDQKKIAVINDAFEDDVDTKKINNSFSENTKSIKAEEGYEKTADVQQINDNLEPKIRKSLWRYPSDKSLARRIWWVYTWPLKLLLTVTVPSPKTYPRLYPLTFVLCIAWIGINSYFVSWMMTLLGETFNISQSIMGMTLLAFGGCLPEACSIFIMSRKGEGGMGVSNSLGANTLAILFSLGIPWFFKSLLSYVNGEEGYVSVESGGITYIIISLLLATLTLWTILKIGKFILNKCTGFTIATAYIVFLTFGILMESGVFFDIGGHSNC